MPSATVTAVVAVASSRPPTVPRARIEYAPGAIPVVLQVVGTVAPAGGAATLAERSVVTTVPLASSTSSTNCVSCALEDESLNVTRTAVELPAAMLDGVAETARLNDGVASGIPSVAVLLLSSYSSTMCVASAVADAVLATAGALSVTVTVDVAELASAASGIATVWLPQTKVSPSPETECRSSAPSRSAQRARRGRGVAGFAVSRATRKSGLLALPLFTESTALVVEEFGSIATPASSTMKRMMLVLATASAVTCTCTCVPVASAGTDVVPCSTELPDGPS